MTKHSRVSWVQMFTAFVVGVLLVLAVLPWLGRARESARRANCLSNFKQLGLATGMYAEMNQGRCPVDSETPTLVGSWGLLAIQIRPLQMMLFCHSDRRASRPAESPDALSVSNISYSYVPNVIWQGAKGDSILALDRIYTTAKGSQWPSDGNHVRRPITELDFSGEQGGNVLFSDGRVEFHKSLPSDLKDKDGKLRVLSP